MRIIIQLCLLCFSITSCAQTGSAGTKPRPKVSKADSIRYVGYLREASVCPLFSVKRQLLLDSALSIAPWKARLWQQKAMPLFKQKKYELGMPYLDLAVEHDTDNGFLEYRAFMKCIFQKSYRAAIIDFDLAIAEKGNQYVMDHTFEFYKGLCYLQLNQFDSAAYFIQKNIDAEKGKDGKGWVHYLHHFYRGVIYFEEEDFENARLSLDACLEIYPQLPGAFYYKGLIAKQLGENEKALTFLRQAKKHADDGYGITEDNTLYETYPYQILPYFLDSYIQQLENE